MSDHDTAATDEFARYRDPANGGAVEWCGDCGAPCVVVRPGKTQCESCDWWRARAATDNRLTGEAR